MTQTIAHPVNVDVNGNGGSAERINKHAGGLAAHARQFEQLLRLLRDAVRSNRAVESAFRRRAFSL